MMKTTLYHRRTNGKIKIWSCWVDNNWVVSEWGQQNGQMSQTREQADNAVEMFNKKVKKRKKKGYVESLDKVVENIKVNDSTLNFDRLPRSFAPAKPIKQLDLGTARAWENKGLLFLQRKRDGMRHYLVSDTKGKIKVYSSGKDDMTEHLQPLLQHLKIPPRTVLDCELVATLPDRFESDGFLVISGIARSLAPRAQAMIKQAQDRKINIRLLAFDLLWLSGEPIYREPYISRYDRLGHVVIQAGGEHLDRMPVMLKTSLSMALDRVIHNKWEGLVVWRRDQATVVQVNGTPKRVNCWKMKNVIEEDVVAVDYVLGKGKNRNVVGKFNIALVDKNGSFKPMGRCGGGLTDEQRQKALSWKYPCVIQIEADQRSEKGFRFPQFIRKREDKKPSECTIG